MSIEAMKQALEALENVRNYDKENLYGLDEDLTALRAAIAEAVEHDVQQEPVAWVPASTPLEFETECSDGTRFLNVAEIPAHAVRWRMVSVPRREWVGLTEEEITACKRTEKRYLSSQEFARAIEAKLKEKNT